MKILLTVTLAMLVSASVFAECKKEGDTCTKDECEKLGTGMGLRGDKCVKVDAAQSETQCASILNSSAGKGSTATQAPAGTTGGSSGKNQ